uniref:Gamma-glutamylcyclotransferase n=1 Tax=Rhabditophanes sp. KR3021 TaxID=114890 RepID=A0AC35TL96_9BILA
MTSKSSALLEEDFFYYFAYGSNLLGERIRILNDTAIFQEAGELKGYKVAFYDQSERWHGGIASIDENSSDNVYGCIYRIHKKQSENLDLQEYGYHRLDVSIRGLKSKKTVLCRTYQYSSTTKVATLPSLGYKTVIVTGAIEHRLPEAYVDMLNSLRHNGKLDEIQIPLQCLKDIQIP